MSYRIKSGFLCVVFLYFFIPANAGRPFEYFKLFVCAVFRRGLCMQNETLKKHNRFENVYNNGRSAVGAHIILIALPNYYDKNRVGFTASKKVGGAVVRNRVKRRLREAYRRCSDLFLTGFDIVIVARRAVVSASFSSLTRSVETLAGRLRIAR